MSQRPVVQLALWEHATPVDITLACMTGCLRAPVSCLKRRQPVETICRTVPSGRRSVAWSVPSSLARWEAELLLDGRVQMRMALLPCRHLCPAGWRAVTSAPRRVGVSRRLIIGRSRSSASLPLTRTVLLPAFMRQQRYVITGNSCCTRVDNRKMETTAKNVIWIDHTQEK